GQQADLLGQERQAGVALGRGGAVTRRRAADGGGDIAAGEGQAIVAVDRGGLGGQPGPVQGGVEPGPGTVAGEDPAGAGGPVGGGGEGGGGGGGGGRAGRGRWARGGGGAGPQPGMRGGVPRRRGPGRPK